MTMVCSFLLFCQLAEDHVAAGPDSTVCMAASTYMYGLEECHGKAFTMHMLRPPLCHLRHAFWSVRGVSLPRKGPLQTCRMLETLLEKCPYGAC